MNSSVFVNLVLYNSSRLHGIKVLKKTINSLLNQKSFSIDNNLYLNIIDNNSNDDSIELLKKEFPKLNYIINKDNIGFSAAHNQGISLFLNTHFDYYLCLNPDILLEENMLEILVGNFKNSNAGSATPLLLKADPDLKPITPEVVDAAGMYFTPSIRHLDRDSGELYQKQYSKSYVSGGTGACLLLKREFIKDLIIESKYDSDVKKVIPNIDNYVTVKFFDEAFLAYREDADLAWRGLLFGWNCLFVPNSIAYHKRYVVPENRKELPREINSLSIRNRFLMIVNNYSFISLKVFLLGFILRNILVLLGVLLVERSSLRGLKEFFSLYNRAKNRRRLIMSKANSSIDKHFAFEPYIEKL